MPIAIHRTALRLTPLLLALAVACTPSTPPATATTAVPAAYARFYDPSRALGVLYHDVQLSGMFPDSKTFADARPKSDPAQIVAAYQDAKGKPGFDLKQFVLANFEIPAGAGEGFHTDPNATMEQHIDALWPVLTRKPDSADARSSLIPLPEEYVVPGGRFREVYYWDSYFTMQGLVTSRRTDLVKAMLDNFAYLIRTVGHIPNGNRSYYLSRSQPPYFAAMVGLYARATDTAQALPYLDALEAEHAFWMDGADRLQPGQFYRRVVMLADGKILNRYWDDRDDPRPEAYRPDYELAQKLPAGERPALYRNLRATAESGWDFSSRWMRDTADLASLETTDLIPVDLNSLLYNQERTIAALLAYRKRPGDAELAAEYQRDAERRRQALLQEAWDPGTAFFYDVNFRTGERVVDRPTLAAAAPLYFGLATPDQGRFVAARLESRFLKRGGFVTTTFNTGQQWDAPNGWAPLEWLAIEGVRRYGRADLADTAATRWLALNRRTFRETGKMTEKYDVVDPERRAGGGEYPTQDGFGWTNGVARALGARLRTTMRAPGPRDATPQRDVRRMLTAPPRSVAPVLSLPERGIDDAAAYRGYQTRFYRDAAGNTVQIYLDGRSGRAVNLLADALDESVGFTARGATGKPASLAWKGDATVDAASGDRTISYELSSDAPELRLGWFLLGSMRVERDFQYANWQEKPFGAPRFALPEYDRFLSAIEKLPASLQREHLADIGAPDVATLRARLTPTVTTRSGDTAWSVRVVQPSFDGRDSLVLELSADPRLVDATMAGDSVTLRAKSGARVPFTVRVTTSGAALTPLTREQIFNADFLKFLDDAKRAGGTRARWLERQTLGVELLSSREKLMAGLPTYATYFGRDMLVSALMMRSIWRSDMSEAAIAAALRKLAPDGEVSHEEALGGQAFRESAGEYASLVDGWSAALAAHDTARADSLLDRVTAVAERFGRTRENYHMIDDEFQLAVLEGRWFADSTVSAEHKRAFLLDSTDGTGSRVERMLRELSVVARWTARYAERPDATALVSFAPRDSGWQSASWRDSGVGYAGGRFAMDVNAIWAPRALEAMGTILDGVRALGISLDSIGRAHPDLAFDSPLPRYAHDPSSLRRATDTWWGAWRHFEVVLPPAAIRSGVAARLAEMPAAERRYWAAKAKGAGAAPRDSLRFLALSLDANARPIPVANTDPATRLFLGEDAPAAFRPGETAESRTLRDVRLFVRDYPVGLFIDRVGPVVANDAYASPAVWHAFERDPYHGPRVVWGREVNLFLLGVAERIAGAEGAGGATQAGATAKGASTAYLRELRDALQQVRTAARASGFHSELWSYDFVHGRPAPVRYGSGADVQLWSTTELAVEFALSRISR